MVMCIGMDHETLSAMSVELLKIAAARTRMTVAQSRAGRRPMRVSTMLQKEKDGTLYKQAGEACMPESGMRQGVLANDLTQMLSPEDAALVRAKLPWYRRTAPGVAPQMALGAIMGGGAFPTILGGPTGNWMRFSGGDRAIGAAVGALAFPALRYALLHSERGKRKSLEAARMALEEAKHAGAMGSTGSSDGSPSVVPYEDSVRMGQEAKLKKRRWEVASVDDPAQKNDRVDGRGEQATQVGPGVSMGSTGIAYSNSGEMQ